jgi:hypothetical protein
MFLQVLSPTVGNISIYSSLQEFFLNIIDKDQNLVENSGDENAPNKGLIDRTCSHLHVRFEDNARRY